MVEVYQKGVSGKKYLHHGLSPISLVVWNSYTIMKIFFKNKQTHETKFVEHSNFLTFIPNIILLFLLSFHTDEV